MPYIVNGRSRLFYSEKGAGNPPLIFVHGVGGTTLHWEKQTEHFGKTNRVVAVDLPGCGRSNRPLTDYSIESSAIVVDNVLENLGIHDYVWVGHSMGGWIGLQYDTMFPSKLRGLVVVDSFVGFAGSPATQGLSRRYSAAKERSSFADVLRGTADAMFRTGGDAEFKDRVRRDYLKTRYETYCGHLAAVLTNMRETFPDRSLIYERSVNTPTLIISRDTDEDRDKAISLFAERIPNVQVKKIAGVGHYIMIDATDEFNQAVTQFINCL